MAHAPGQDHPEVAVGLAEGGADLGLPGTEMAKAKTPFR